MICFCKKCGWKGIWEDVTQKQTKKYETTIYCPSCNTEGVTVTYKDEEQSNGEINE